MWSGFWDTIERITSKRVQFKFLDGVGQTAILVDGCKPQATACGDALLTQIIKRGDSTPFKERDPLLIIQYVLRTCDIHLER
jgi:hypothetical protein